MKNISLNLPNASDNIGDSINKLNNVFNNLKSYIDDLNDVKGVSENFQDSVNVWLSELQYSLDFMNKNNKKYLNLFEEVLNKRDLLVKPLMLFYPTKIRSDVAAYDRLYTQNLIHDWISKYYPIKTPKIEKPNYVEGQKAVVYFLRNEEIEAERNESQSDFIQCFTQDFRLYVACVTKRTGQVCVPGCGCVGCAGQTYCSNSDLLDCYFPDLGLRRNSVLRYLSLNMKYSYEDFSENKFDIVRFIVDECEWKVDNTPIISTPKAPPKNIDNGIETFVSKNQIQTFTGDDIDPF